MNIGFIQRFIAVLILGFFVSGCTSKTSSYVKPYVTLNQNKEQKIKVNLVEVNDQRDTKVVSTILKKDKTKTTYTLDTDITSWYTQALKRELNTVKMYDEKSSSKIDVTVNIKVLKAIYKKDAFDKKNMSVHIMLELVFKEGLTTHKSNININQTAYKPVVLDAEGFETILNESMIDSVSNTIAILIKKLNK